MFIAYHGAMRKGEHMELRWNDITIDYEKEFVTFFIKKSKNGSSRSFIINDKQFFKVFTEYKDEIPQGREELYPTIHHNTGKFTKGKGRGEKWYAGLALRVANILQLDTSKNFFSHHSFRRSAATSMLEEGCSTRQIRSIGGWKSDGGMVKYLVNSEVSMKRNAGAKTTTFNNSGEPEPKRSSGNITLDVNRNDTVHNALNQLQSLVTNQTNCHNVFNVTFKN